MYDGCSKSTATGLISCSIYLTRTNYGLVTKVYRFCKKKFFIFLVLIYCKFALKNA